MTQKIPDVRHKAVETAGERSSSEDERILCRFANEYVVRGICADNSRHESVLIGILVQVITLLRFFLAFLRGFVWNLRRVVSTQGPLRWHDLEPDRQFAMSTVAKSGSIAPAAVAWGI